MIIGGVLLLKRLGIVVVICLYFYYMMMWLSRGSTWELDTEALLLSYIGYFSLTLLFTMAAGIVIGIVGSLLREILKWIRYG